ncbi:unnamed protein product [Rotaria sp. Silwood2]|nr:unnamed protein product [Rotaria sp. Silwood2]CAF3144673.1 unnamed protein product [Rotaria sp. Silwood2]CAF3428225.1 unnamed protein product [Rotaria sp. Silwood2]CAF4169869.1 unnamed protein product [Rotaria sp. Silwood2]CAF4202376.1 unnamed protein product [Rotaria sp. Silwood2]
MSNKDPRSGRYHNSEDVIKADKRDVELTFLKKVNMNHQRLNSPSGSDQGGKRGRTSSDDDYERHVTINGTPKRSRSIQRNTRTFTNSSLSATTTCNNDSNSNSRMDNENIQSNNNNNGKNVNVNNDSSIFNFSRNAIDYAINQHLPPIKIICEPKIGNQKEGGIIIKGLIKSIEKDFKGINPRHNDLIGFDSWYINFNGDICCITNDIDLFVYLCDDKNVPNKVENTIIYIIKPRNLPPQRSVIIKNVPNSSCLEDMKVEVMNKFKSIYYFDEVLGTNNGRTRFIRIDLLNHLEYKQIMNAGIICIDGQCFHVHEFLAAPRVMFCSMCNLPGHIKRHCKFIYERCKRCGGNRKEGEHKECKITCHNCQGEHVATDFRCPTVHSYRNDLIQYLRQHPEALPNDTQIFIPSSFRQEGGKVLGKRMIEKNQVLYHYKPTKSNSNPAWPSISPKAAVYEPNINLNYPNVNIKEHLNIKDYLNRIETQCNEAKQDYDRKFNDTTTKINTCLNQVQSILNCFSSTIQRQNEMIYVLKTSLNECLEIIKITNQGLCLLMEKTGEQQYGDMIKQITALPLDERQASINKFFSAYSPLIDEITMKIMVATENLHIHNG